MNFKRWIVEIAGFIHGNIFIFYCNLGSSKAMGGNQGIILKITIGSNMAAIIYCRGALRDESRFKLHPSWIWIFWQG